MDIVFSCPKCGNKYRMEAERAGETTVCGWCSTMLLVPAPSASAIARQAPISEEMWPPGKSGIKRGEGSGLQRGGDAAPKPVPPKPVEGSGLRRGEGSGLKRGEGSGLKRGEGSGLKRGSPPPVPAFASDGDIHSPGPQELTEALPPFIAATKSNPANPKPAGSTIKGSAAKSKVTRNLTKVGVSAIGKRAQPLASQPWLVWAAVGSIVGATLVTITVIVVMSVSNTPAPSDNQKLPALPKTESKPKGAKKKLPPVAVAATGSKGKFVFHWPETERKDAAVFLGSKKRNVPATGPVEFAADPGEHDLIIVRRGYDQIEQHVTLTAGGVQTIEPKFAPLWASSLADLRKNDSLRHGPEEVVAVANVKPGSSSPSSTA